MTTERDELAKLLFITDNHRMKDPEGEWHAAQPEHRTYVYALADAAMAAGYRKPRKVTTFDGLTELPDGAVIRDASGDVAERRGGEWCSHETRPLSDKLLSKYLPVEVLA